MRELVALMNRIGEERERKQKTKYSMLYTFIPLLSHHPRVGVFSVYSHVASRLIPTTGAWGCGVGSFNNTQSQKSWPLQQLGIQPT